MTDKSKTTPAFISIPMDVAQRLSAFLAEYKTMGSTVRSGVMYGIQMGTEREQSITVEDLQAISDAMVKARDAE